MEGNVGDREFDPRSHQFAERGGGAADADIDDFPGASSWIRIQPHRSSPTDEPRMARSMQGQRTSALTGLFTNPLIPKRLTELTRAGLDIGVGHHHRK